MGITCRYGIESEPFKLRGRVRRRQLVRWWSALAQEGDDRVPVLGFEGGGHFFSRFYSFASAPGAGALDCKFEEQGVVI